MKRSDELIVEIRAKKKEVENLHKAGETSKAAKVAEELDAICDEYQIQKAKEKSNFDNFLAAKDRGEYSMINPSEEEITTGKKAIASTKYHNAVMKAIRHNFKNELDPILKEGVDTAGGYLLPLEMDKTISQKLEEENIMRQLSTVISTESLHRVPIVTSKPQAAWVKEGQKIPFTDEHYSKIDLDAYKLAASIRISNELLEDASYNLESHFQLQFVQAIARSEENAFINGSPDTDTATPTGFLTELASEATATIQSGSPDANNPGFSENDILRLVYALERPYRKNAVFLTHDSAMLKIRQFKDTQQRYLWTPMTDGEGEKLFGYPVYTSPYFPKAETAGDIAVAFGDFSRFVVADRGVRSFRPLYELYAMEGLTAFLMTERVDAKLLDKNAIKLLAIR